MKIVHQVRKNEFEMCVCTRLFFAYSKNWPQHRIKKIRVMELVFFLSSFCNCPNGQRYIKVKEWPLFVASIVIIIIIIIIKPTTTSTKKNESKLRTRERKKVSCYLKKMIERKLLVSWSCLSLSFSDSDYLYLSL